MSDAARFGISRWYTTLADHTFPTTFVKLKDDELALIRDGVSDTAAATSVLPRLEMAMTSFGGAKFVSADTVSPTDTERFSQKYGAVHSAASAWRFLTESAKVRAAAANRDFECICVRPYRSITRPREFRLFIREGKLVFMSQYWLTRHFRRVEGRKAEFWVRAERLVSQISWLLPAPTVVLDIYFTASSEILLIDFNPWGAPTQALLAGSWERDWTGTTSSAATLPPPP